MMEEMSSVMWAVIIVGQGLWIFAAVCWSMALDALLKLGTSPDISYQEAEQMERPAERAERKAMVASVLAFVIAQLNSGVLYFAPWTELLNYAFCVPGLAIAVAATIYNYSLYRNVTRYTWRKAQEMRRQRGRKEADELLEKSELAEKAAMNG